MTTEASLRLLAFAAIFLVMALWEWRSPRRRLQLRRVRRWPANLAVLGLNTLLLRLMFPAALAGIATWANAQSLGLFHYFPAVAFVQIALSVVLLDLAIYVQHVLFHHVPLLWRIHRMHHADLEIDVSTGGRFHPLEILLSFAYKAAWIVALGAPVVAVIVFEVLLNAASMFNHGNVKLSPGIDQWIRRLLVTPDMHRVHHSIDPRETDRNFGFSLSVWDRLFGTYQAAPKLGHTSMQIGLPDIRSPKELALSRLLSQPFRSRFQSADQSRGSRS